MQLKEQAVHHDALDDAFIAARLEALAEKEYQAFASNLLPGVDDILGVRLPLIRKLAREIARSDWRAYLQATCSPSFEQTMLEGMVIGYGKCSIEERLFHVARFVPKITNWSVCDSFCAGLKAAKEQPMKVRQFLQPYLLSEREFDVRFAVVMLLWYYTGPAYIEDTLAMLARVRHRGYYAQMAVAWAVSACYAAQPHLVKAWLEKSGLDDFTYRKALQKIGESKKLNAFEKKAIRLLRQKDPKET